MSRLRFVNSLFAKKNLIFAKLSSCKYCTRPIKFLEVQEKWRRIDGVSKNWELIYKAPMEQAIKWAATYVTVTTGLVAAGGVYYALVVHQTREFNQQILLGSSDIVIADNFYECMIYVSAFVMFHFAIKKLISKYVLRIYKDGDQYLAIFRGHMFHTLKKHEFDLHGFKQLRPTFVVSWGDARYSLSGRHGIILDNYFKTPQYLNYLLYKKKLM